MGKFAERFLNMVTLSDDEDEGFEDEYDEMLDDEYLDEDDEYEEEKPKQRKRPFLSFRRRKKETEDSLDESEEKESRVIQFHGKEEEEEVVKVIKPQEFNEAQVVAEFLKEGKTIVVNLEGIEISQAQRIIDFIGGASYAVDGSLKAISNNIFIVAPGNIEVSGDLRDEIISDSMISPELSKF